MRVHVWSVGVDVLDEAFAEGRAIGGRQFDVTGVIGAVGTRRRRDECQEQCGAEGGGDRQREEAEGDQDRPGKVGESGGDVLRRGVQAPSRRDA